MFIAHLPAGYLLGQTLRPLTCRVDRCALMVGSILPDVDLLLFYFRDAQSIHHHDYLTHRPLFWAVFLCLGCAFGRFAAARLLVALALGALLHVLLDTHLGAINWGWPLFEFKGPLIIVPASRSHWILSFLSHWTFAIELAICGFAIAVWLTQRTQKNPGQ